MAWARESCCSVMDRLVFLSHGPNLRNLGWVVNLHLPDKWEFTGREVSPLDPVVVEDVLTHLTGLAHCNVSVRLDADNVDLGSLKPHLLPLRYDRINFGMNGAGMFLGPVVLRQWIRASVVVPNGKDLPTFGDNRTMVVLQVGIKGVFLCKVESCSEELVHSSESFDTKLGCVNLLFSVLGRHRTTKSKHCRPRLLV